jgi:hypothetical protein
MAHDEVDLADIFKRQFQKARSVTFGIGRPDFEFKVVLLRIEKREQLRVRQKDIYVATFAMIDLQHHRGAAAQRPIIDNGLL